MFLRRFWLPTSACTMVVYAKENPSNKSCEPPPKEPPVVCERRKIRASELPIYLDEPPCNKCNVPEQKELLLVNTIRTVRLEVWNFLDQLGSLKQQTSALILDAKTHVDSGLEYLREESNVVPRFGAIAIGGLGGYVLALRKGKFKRLLYTTTGAGAMAALCYPREAKEYSSLAFNNLKKYVIIGYHLFNGVSKDLIGYELPSLPFGRHHLHVSDKREEDAVPPPEHLLPPVAVPTHIHVHPGKKPVVD